MTPADLAELKRLRNAAIAAVALDDGVDRSRKQTAYYNAILGRSDTLIAAAEECERMRGVARKLAEIARIHALYEGPPCHNERHADSTVIAHAGHGNDYVELTLGDCRVAVEGKP